MEVVLRWVVSQGLQSASDISISRGISRVGSYVNPRLYIPVRVITYCSHTSYIAEIRRWYMQLPRLVHCLLLLGESGSGSLPPKLLWMRMVDGVHFATLLSDSVMMIDADPPNVSS